MASSTFLGEGIPLSIIYEKFIDFAELKGQGLDLSDAVSSQ